MSHSLLSNPVEAIALSVPPNPELPPNSELPLEPMPIRVSWLDSGKPIVQGLETEAVEVSLSHDDQVCLCVAGINSQGCDILPITPRSQDDWVALLTNARQPLLQQLVQGNDSLDQAGSRIWAAMEALRKATNLQKVELAIGQRQGDSVTFRGTTPDQQLSVLTFPFALTRGEPRMVAIITSDRAA